MDQAELNRRLPTKTRKILDCHEASLAVSKKKKEREQEIYEDKLGEGIEKHLGDTMDTQEQSMLLGAINCGPPRGGWPVFDKQGNVISTSLTHS